MAVYGPWLQQVFSDYLTGKTVKVLVVTSAYVQDVDAAYRSQITDVATGAGYTSGGVIATGVSASYDPATDALRITCDDVDFGVVTIPDVGGFVFYVDTGSAATDLLIAADLLASPIETDGTSTLLYRPHADGLVVATNGAP